MPTEPENHDAPQDVPSPVEPSRPAEVELEDSFKTEPELVEPKAPEPEAPEPQPFAARPTAPIVRPVPSATPPTAPTTAPAVGRDAGPSVAAGTSEESRLLESLIGDGHLLTPVVLIGASALIPVPFLDDFAKAYLERRLYRTVGEREKVAIPSEDLKNLTREAGGGCCALGCLGNAVIYPIKRLLRKILFFLEIKRAVDQSSTALAEAFLFSLALRRGLWSPGRSRAEAETLRDVIEATCQGHGVTPLEAAFNQAFLGAKGTLTSFASRMTGRSVEDEEGKLDEAVRQFEDEESERLDSLKGKLNEALANVSESYLKRFAEEFQKQLAEASKRPR